MKLYCADVPPLGSGCFGCSARKMFLHIKAQSVKSSKLVVKSISNPANVLVFQGFFGIIKICRRKISYFLSAANFAFNVGLFDRIRAWEFGTAPLRLASCAHFGVDAYQKSGQQIKELQKRNAQLEEENLILKKAIFTPHSGND